MPIYLDNAATTKPAPAVIEAITEALSRHYGNPSSLHRMGLEAQLMVYDKEQYAELQAFRILGEMKGDTLDANKARLLLQLIDWSADWMAKPDFAEAAKQQIDREVNDMSIDKQMRIYTSVVPPATLGLELKADREAPNADMQLIEKQIKELERIYTPEQLDEFRKAYGNE